MCANCGFPSAPGHWTEAGAATAPDRLRARFRRVQVLATVLPAYGLAAHDDGVTPGIIVATKTGNQEIVADVTEVWAAAERMVGRVIDPLDPRFIGGEGLGAEPSPPCGERVAPKGLGEGSSGVENVVENPSPSPSPQAGGERGKLRAAPQAPAPA